MKNEHRLNLDDIEIKIPLGNMTINVLYLRFMPTYADWLAKNHSHSSYELHFIPYGKGWLRVQQQTFDIEPGTFYLTGPGIFHEQKTDAKDPMGEYCINFELIATDKKEEKSNQVYQHETQEITNILTSTTFWFGKDEHNSIKLFDRLSEEMRNEWVGYYLNVQNLVCQIIINAVRCFVKDKKVSYNLPQKDLDDKRRNIIDIYFEKYHQPLSPQELAKLIGVSTRQLNRVMKQYFNMTFKERLIQVRLENAKDLLTTTALGVDKIVEKTGFSSTSYFCKVFKEYEGMTPTDYRKRGE